MNRVALIIKLSGRATSKLSGVSLNKYIYKKSIQKYRHLLLEVYCTALNVRGLITAEMVSRFSIVRLSDGSEIVNLDGIKIGTIETKLGYNNEDFICNKISLLIQFIPVKYNGKASIIY